MWFMLGFVGWCMTFYGVYQIGNLNIRGFYWMLAAEALIITDALAFGHFSLIFASVIFFCINTRNVLKWRRNAKTRNIESDFFAQNPQYTMQVLRDNQGISVDISHDTHAESDSLVYRNYIDGADEQEMRREAIQNIIDRDSA